MALPIPAFSANVISVLGEMREMGEYCDVRIKAEGKCFLAHRVILAARIPYFGSMFLGHFAESKEDEITLEQVDPNALECLIDFVYTGKLCITTSNVETLLANAIYLRFDSAIEGCFSFLLKEMKYNNLLLIRKYACADNHPGMIEVVDRYLRENFDNFSESQVLLDMDCSALKELLSRNDLQVMSEEVVFEAVLRWVKAKETERLIHLQNLLSYVRMPLLSSQYLLKRVCADKLIQSSNAYENILHAIAKDHSPSEGTRCFKSGERYCKEKHHLKCKQMMGCSLYCSGVSANSRTICVHYYDCFHNKWVSLYNNLLELCRFIENVYVVSTEGNLYFITPGTIVTICLETLQRTCIQHQWDIPRKSKVALWRRKVYFLGDDNDYDSSSLIWCLSLQHGTCIRTGRMALRRARHGVVPLGQYIYITGGSRFDANDDDDLFLCSAERYDPETKHSTEISQMLVGRAEHGFAALGGKMYVCGGFNKHGQEFPFELPCEVYDPVTDQWAFIPTLSRETTFVLLVSYAGKLYVFRTIRNRTQLFQVYDPDKNEWNSDTTLSIPEMRVKSIFVTNKASSIRFTY